MMALPTVIKYTCPVTATPEEFRLVDFKLGKAVYACVPHGFKIMIDPEEARAIALR